MAEDTDDIGALKKLGQIFKKTVDSKAGQVVGSILKETPVGKAGRVLKDISDIFGEGADDETVLREAMKNATPEQIVQLEQIRTNLQIEEVNERVEARREVSGRHKIDMLSDSPLNKMVRPGVCIGLNITAALYSWAILTLMSCRIAIQILWGYNVQIDAWEEDLIASALGYMWTAAGGYNIFYAGFRMHEKNQSMKSTADIIRG